MYLERVMPIYAPGIVSFDLEPPLLYSGAQAKRKAWARVSAMYQPPLRYEIRDLYITLSDDVGFSHGLNRLSGTFEERAPDGFLGSLYGVLLEDRRQMAHRARADLGACRSRERQSVPDLKP